jgi:hypothetical protein
MTKYSVKKGLKEFGQAGTEAVMAEMRQLNGCGVIEPRQSSMLTQLEKHRALHYVMFLKKKRCGKIKGQGCADGRKQRIYKSKVETSEEGRSIITADIPGAFMQADMDEVIHMKREGPLTKLLVQVNPKNTRST